MVGEDCTGRHSALTSTPAPNKIFTSALPSTLNSLAHTLHGCITTLLRCTEPLYVVKMRMVIYIGPELIIKSLKYSSSFKLGLIPLAGGDAVGVRKETKSSSLNISLQVGPSSCFGGRHSRWHSCSVRKLPGLSLSPFSLQPPNTKQSHVPVFWS